MSRSTNLMLLLLTLLLCNSSHGFGRRVKVLRRSEKKTLLEGVPGFGRMMQEMTEMDYRGPGANTNPRSGTIPNNPPPYSPPPFKHY